MDSDKAAAILQIVVGLFVIVAVLLIRRSEKRELRKIIARIDARQARLIIVNNDTGELFRPNVSGQIIENPYLPPDYKRRLMQITEVKK